MSGGHAGGSPGEEDGGDRHGLESGIAAGAYGNSTAFGYSIMITVTFAAVSRIQERGDILDYLGFAFGAAIAVGVVNAVITRGFRRRLQEVPAEILMLGAAINFASVLGAVGAGIGVAEILPELLGWTLAAFTASGLYVLLEGSEFWVAEKIQARRGDTAAEKRID